MVGNALDFLLHVDVYLIDLVTTYGSWIYAILFIVVFAETGFVVTPFLPGDSLLFAAGALAATEALDIRVLAVLLVAAAVGGNTVNYAIGRSIGARIVDRARSDPRWGRWIKPAYVDRAREFFVRHGGKAVVVTRFMPIVRTFVPFVAGVARMPPSSFGFYNVTGGIAWVAICLGAGYLFGTVPAVKNNFSLVAIGIVIVSLLPVAAELLRHVRRAD